MLVLLYTLIATGYLLFLVIAILLIRTFRRTRNVGFLWLGAAILVWPVVARAVASGLRSLVNRGGVGPFEFGGRVLPLFTVSQQVLGLALVLIAVFHLARRQVHSRSA